ncbi:MAG: hypothetical protein Q8P72_05770 [Candidatus Roizmanbacteria bacterium]|nr:hypothetical protein [Candidatus Roizmanbacteria bacterium]
MDLLDSTNSATGDFDNDGQNEIAIVVPDYLNREYTMLMVIDKVEGGFKLDQRKIPLGYLSSAISSTKHEGAIETRDLTGDAIPELLVFASNWRWGARLYTFTYSQGKINQLFALNDAYNHPTFTFSDQNNNRITEIHATGEKLGLMAYDFECNACLHVRVKDVYEYQPETQSFLQTEKKYYGHAGALTTFLEEVGEFQYDHPLLQHWAVDKKKRFSYILDQLEESGVSSLFESTDPQQYSSKEERDIVTVQLRRPMKLSDLAVREEESSNEKERRLSYYISSPAYEVVIKKSGGEWKVTAFDEIN